MFTHFADADGSEEYTMGQLTKFLDAKQTLEKQGVTFQNLPLRGQRGCAKLSLYPYGHGAPRYCPVRLLSRS